MRGCYSQNYPALKTFIAAAYTRRILAQQLRNNAGQQGYAPTSHNMYNVFAKEDNTDTTATTMTNIAALMTEGTITATIPDSLVANAINQLSTNKTALMNQMAAMLYANVPPPPTLQYQPPIQQLTVPVKQPFSKAALGGFNHGNG